MLEVHLYLISVLISVQSGMYSTNANTGSFLEDLNLCKYLIFPILVLPDF